MSDRYRIEAGGVTFTISPLTRGQKIQINDCVKNISGNMEPDIFEMQCLYLRFGLKAVEGVTYSDGEPFILTFENGELSDESLDEVLNIPQKAEIMTAAWQFLNGAPDEVVDPISGKVLEGVKVKIEQGKSKGA